MLRLVMPEVSSQANASSSLARQRRWKILRSSEFIYLQLPIFVDSVKICVYLKDMKKITLVERQEALVSALKELPRVVGARKVVPALDLDYTSDLLTVVPIGDPHIGMLSWWQETGESFDMDIAVKKFGAASEYMFSRGPATEKALLINLGDFFHTDNTTNETNKSRNKLDVDGRWHRIIRAGLGVFVGMIDCALHRHKEVRVICEIGNHDEHSSVFLQVALNAYYRNEPRVTIDMSPKLFHYYRFHNNLIGVTHGHTIRPKELGGIMATDMAKDWGQTEYHYWYTGHVHNSSKVEMPGCTQESFRTLAPKDAWHYGAGYRSRCDMVKILLHKDYGEIFRLSVDSNLIRRLCE